MSSCDHPKCQYNVFDEYEDANGNTLDLCQTHFYEAVTGRRIKSKDRDTFAGVPAVQEPPRGITSEGTETGGSSELFNESPFSPRGLRR